MALRIDRRFSSSTYLVTGSGIIDATHPSAVQALQREAGVSSFEQSIWRRAGGDGVEASRGGDGA